jgi:hypothetical protein
MGARLLSDIKEVISETLAWMGKQYQYGSKRN